MQRSFPVYFGVCAAVWLSLLLGGQASAAVPVVRAATAPAKTLLIGTTFAPPFAMQQPDGQWTGLSVDLWRAVARRLGWHYRIVGMSFGQLLQRVQDRSLDAGIGAITVTVGRQQRMDFSQPFYFTGLAIAVRAQRESTWRLVLGQLLSLKFLALILSLLALLAGTGVMIWLLEGRRNRLQFGGGVLKGVGSGMWWSAQTMTGVGYGDIVPRTPWGRVFGIAWMIIGVMAVSSFTASVAATLTVGRLASPRITVRTLRTMRVGTVTPSTSADYLTKLGIKPVLFHHVRAALLALKNRKIQALVYDAPILRYFLRGRIAGDIRILPELVQRQYYAVALPDGSPLRRAISDALLEEINSAQWHRLKARYLGPAP